MDYQLHKAQDWISLAVVNDVSYRDIASFLYSIGDIECTLPQDLVIIFDNPIGTNEHPSINLYWSGDSNVEHIKYEINSILVDDRVLVKGGVSSNAYSKDVSRISMKWSDFTREYTQSGESTQDQAWSGFLYPENNTLPIWNHVMEIMSAGLLNSAYLLPDIEFWVGAISQVQPKDTAFPYRRALYNVGVLLTVPADMEDSQEIYKEEVSKVNSWWPLVSQYLTGAYVNYPMASLGQDEFARSYWGENLERLKSIKNRYDPDNVLQFEQNITRLNSFCNH